MENTPLVKSEAVNIIQKIRNAKQGNRERERGPVLEFHLPKCIFAAASYTDLMILEATAVEMVSPILPTKKDI